MNCSDQTEGYGDPLCSVVSLSDCFSSRSAMEPDDCSVLRPYGRLAPARGERSGLLSQLLRGSRVEEHLSLWSVASGLEPLKPRCH
ncbi:unnamed protein product [Boreogadus saida]